MRELIHASPDTSRTALGILIGLIERALFSETRRAPEQA